MTQSSEIPRKNKGGPQQKPGITGVIIFWGMFATVSNFIGIILFAFFNVGDEIQCGRNQVAYLAGEDWLGYVILACAILTVVAISMLSKANK